MIQPTGSPLSGALALHLDSPEEIVAEGHCRNCEERLSGSFCAQCGQAADVRMVPLHHWLGQAWGSMLGLDFKFLRTLKSLLVRPGHLTEEYARGRRVPYTSPLRLYIVASALAIAVMSLYGVLSFDAVAQQLDADLWRALGVDNPDDPTFRKTFDQRLNLIFPIVNLTSPVLLALLLKALYRRRWFEFHLVFSFHFFTFVVLAGLALLPLLTQQESASDGLALFILVLLTTVLSGYLAIAQKRVYGGGWASYLPRLAILVLGLNLINQGLSVVVFLLTLISI